MWVCVCVCAFTLTARWRQRCSCPVTGRLRPGVYSWPSFRCGWEREEERERQRAQGEIVYSRASNNNWMEIHHKQNRRQYLSILLFLDLLFILNPSLSSTLSSSRTSALSPSLHPLLRLHPHRPPLLLLLLLSVMWLHHEEPADSSASPPWTSKRLLAVRRSKCSFADHTHTFQL